MNVTVQTPARAAATPLLELDLMRTLVAIAETGNFSAAAERVGRTPSAVSMQVKKMEETVGATVFVRDSRSVSLTRDGEALLQHARRVLALNQEMMSRFIAPDLVGEVRLGAPDDVAERFLPRMLRGFAEAYPGIVLDVTVDGTSRLLEAVAKDELDLSIVTCESGFATDGLAEIIFREPLVWACLAGGVAAERTPIPVSMWEEGCKWRRAATEALDHNAVDYRITFQSSNISGQRAAVLADLAVAPLSKSHISGRIVEVKPSVGMPALPECALGLVVRDDPPRPVLAAADLVRDCFKKHDH
ncbi:MAG: LysR substrate-binding domain-containing protein [Pseudomonadota bacterium]